MYYLFLLRYKVIALMQFSCYFAIDFNGIKEALSGHF